MKSAGLRVLISAKLARAKGKGVHWALSERQTPSDPPWLLGQRPLASQLIWHWPPGEQKHTFPLCVLSNPCPAFHGASRCLLALRKSCRRIDHIWRKAVLRISSVVKYTHVAKAVVT